MKTTNNTIAKTNANAKATKATPAKTAKAAKTTLKAKATKPAPEKPKPEAVESKPIALLPEYATPAPEAEVQTVPETPAEEVPVQEPQAAPISEKDDMTGQLTVMLDMKTLRPSPYNPRKYYDKQGITELAATLNEVGLLQPVHVRAVGEHYEIIFGERRYHAAQSLKWKKIEAYIRTVSDEVARDMALTENLQREDMRPMDEAAAYLQLTKEGKDIYTLAAKYGKSDRYIYDRLKLNELIPAIADLLNRNLIGIGVALEISKCERHIQEDMYERHLKGESENDDNPASGWRGKGVTDFKDLIRRTYTTDLEQYYFDKTECRKCGHNTNTYDLFANCNGKCGHCTNADCLNAKNDAYVLAKTAALLKENPRAVLGKDSYGRPDKVVEKLVGEGYEAKGVGYSCEHFPTEPTAPDKDKYSDPEKFAEAEERYRKDLARYEKETARINGMIESGNARVYVYPVGKDVQLRYKTVNKRSGEDDFVKRLTEQKQTNILKALEKTVEATRDIVYKNVEPATEFTAFEDTALYFLMLGALKMEHCQALTGEKYACHLSSEQRIKVLQNLTQEQKDMIRRDYLSAYLYSRATNDKIIGKMLCEYAHMHYAGQFDIAKARIDEECENKNNRLDERIAEFQAKEKVKAEAAAKKEAKDAEQKQKAKAAKKEATPTDNAPKTVKLEKASKAKTIKKGGEPAKKAA